MKLYLTGPITGSDDNEIDRWREIVSEQLGKNFQIIDPAHASRNSLDSYKMAEKPMARMERRDHGQFVIARNKSLIQSSDIVLANFLGAKDRASIGSVGEIFWANLMNKPIVIIRDKVGNVHDHAMLNAVASKICYSLNGAFSAVKDIQNTLLRSAEFG